MKRIALIACASKKKPYRAKARELYDSDLFRLSLRFAEEMEPDEIYILSAKHGLLHPDQVINASYASYVFTSRQSTARG